MLTVLAMKILAFLLTNIVDIMAKSFAQGLKNKCHIFLSWSNIIGQMYKI